MHKERIRQRNKQYRENHKEEFKQRHKQYQEKIYEECEKGIIRDTCLSKIFDFMNKNPNASLEDAYHNFYNMNPNIVAPDYYRWFQIGIKKYIENN